MINNVHQKFMKREGAEFGIKIPWFILLSSLWNFKVNTRGL